MMQVSRDVLPWSVILPHLQQQCSDAAKAEQAAEQARKMLKMWKDLTYATVFTIDEYHPRNLFSAHVGHMLSSLLGHCEARKLVLQTLQEEASKEYLGMSPQQWQPGGRGWRLFMLLAGECIEKDAKRFKHLQPTATVWKNRLADGLGRYGTRWGIECLIETGRKGEASVPDENSDNWVDGLTDAAVPLGI